MLQEFCKTLGKYWLFIGITLTMGVSGYIGSTDVNFGVDVSGKFLWITSEGWRSLIYNSDDLTDEAKSILLANNTLS